MLRSPPLVPLLLLALAASPLHADEIRTERVYFAPGGTGVVIAGSIEGRERVDYLLGAKAGQTLEVVMDSDNTAAYFNLIPPDAEHAAVYTGSTGAELNRYKGELDRSGDWKIRVYLDRAAARAGESAGESADYRLDIGITGGEAVYEIPAADDG